MAQKFTLIADGDTNDAEKGLTSDSISTGGLLEPAPIEENVFTSASATTLSPSETAVAYESATTRATGTVSSPQSHALRFNGVGENQYVDLGTDAGDPQQFTVSFWVSVGQIDNQDYNDYRHLVTDNGGNFILIEADGSITFRVPGVAGDFFNGGNIEGTAHVACTYDQSDRIIHVNGEEVARENVGSGTVDLSFPLLISSNSRDRNLDGRMKDIRVYDAAKTDQEITDLYNGYDVQADLIHHWKADGGSGTTLTDYAGNSDGTITGATWTRWPQLFEIASTTVGVQTTEATASTLSIADVARAIESSTLTAAAETFVSEVTRAIESPDTLTVNAVPIIVDDIARANESATLEALAQTTIIYIPPLPRMGLEADTTDASLSYGTNFDP